MPDTDILPGGIVSIFESYIFLLALHNYSYFKQRKACIRGYVIVEDIMS